MGKTYVYTYDYAGNRTSKKTYAYTAGSLSSLIYTEEVYEYSNVWGDQLTKANGGTISYDAIGNPTAFNGYDLTWHGRQLKQMSRNGGQSLLKFKYNADGIRTNKIVNGADHVYTLNGSQIVSEAWSTHLVIYLYDESGSPIGLQYRSKTYAANTFDTFYFEKNLQGDIIAVYNASGEKIGTYTYDAWGNCTVSVVSGNTTLETNIVRTYNPFRYRGYYYDIETQLYYLQSRYYNPAWGRFLNVDVYISTGTGLLGYNMYSYCDNNPVMYVDPFGQAGFSYLSDYDDGYNMWLECLEGGAGSAYSTYTIRCRTATYDAQLGGYYSDGMTAACLHPSLYIVPGAVSVTDDMVTNPPSSPSSPYSHLEDPPGVAPGKDFTAKQKTKIIRENKIKNGGVVKSDLSGQKLSKPQKSQKGVSPSPREYQVDHIVPKSKGGTNSYSNAQVLSRQENRIKWDK